MTKELVTKQRAKRINTAVEVQTQTPHEANSIGFSTRNLAIANLPYNDPKTDRWTRTNGNFTFEMVALRKNGKIPYGVIPRLFMIWLISEIVNPQKQQRTNKYEIVLGHHFSDFLEKIGYKEDGGYTRKRVRQQMEWLFNVAMGSYTDDKTTRSTEGSVPKAFVKWYKFYWDDKKKNETQQPLFPSFIILEEDFYNEVVKSPIPIDMRVVEAFKNSPMKLDIYIWLTYKMFSVREPLHINYEDLMLQFGTNFSDVIDKTGKKTNTAINNFRLKFRKALKEVIDVYPVKVNITSPKHIILYASPTSVPKKITCVK